jgi:hypothetical protein
MTSTGKFVSFQVYCVCFLFWIFFSFGSSSFCRSTEHDHMKDNLPAKLLHIRTFGKMKLEDFKDLISPVDYNTCLNKMDKHPTWYSLTLDIFVKFLYKVFHPSLPYALRAHKLTILPSKDSDINGLCIYPLHYCHSVLRISHKLVFILAILPSIFDEFF